MEENSRVYRIRTDVGSKAPNVIHVPLNQTYDMFEILSLKINQTNTYQRYESEYGVIVGRVMANGGFGVENAKISIFIPVSDDDTEKDRLLYNFNVTYGKDNNGVRYNLLPDFVDDACHQNVGTFPNKRYVLDNDNVIDMFDKYWKFTTTTNHAGDYFLFGIPTGSQQLHCDLDLSDCGVLSQRPWNMMEKGYNSNLFDSPNKFKSSTNLNSLAQIITQEKTVYVYPYWGDTSEGEERYGITRCDIDIDYKFEANAIFMGSIVTDKGSNAIGKNCTATEKNGRMSDLIAGEGKIEMIRKTNDGKVESFAIMGNRLIDGDGVWCYSIPMNLDYVVTDEFGNLVPTDDPNRGIATRARVRFRITMDDTPEDTTARKRARYLVPNNPQVDDEGLIKKNDADYEFGSGTRDESFRDLLWNKVYTVKNYIPKLQKNQKPKNTKHTGIKLINQPDDNNPMPYNSMVIRLPIMYRIMCVITKIIIDLVSILNGALSVIGWLPCWLATLCFLGICPFKGMMRFVPHCVPLSSDFCDDGVNPNIYYPGCFNCVWTKKTRPDCQKEQAKQKKGERHICTNSTAELRTCIENELAKQNEAVSFEFNNDWINGVLYAPLWHRRIRPKKTLLFGLIRRRAKDEWCSEKEWFDDLYLIQHCAVERKGHAAIKNFDNKSFQASYTTTDSCGDKCHETSAYIQGMNGLIKTTDTILDQTVYYYKAVDVNAFGQTGGRNTVTSTGVSGRFVRLFATDIVLLGSLNECDLHGIPQFFKNLESTTYNMPTDVLFNDHEIENVLDSNGKFVEAKYTTHSEAAGCDWSNKNEYGKSDGGLFYDIGCNSIHVVPKSCINLSRICEYGVSLDETKDIANLNTDGIYDKLITDGFISYDELYALDERAMFATMNSNRLKTRLNPETGLVEYDLHYLYPDNFDGSLKTQMTNTTKTYDPQISYKNNYKLEAFSRDYYIFRMGNHPYFYYGKQRFPRYENSFYFYFGLKAGKTAIEKFNAKYFADCSTPDNIDTQISIDIKPNCWCAEATQDSDQMDGYISFDCEKLATPFDLLINNKLQPDISLEIRNITDEKILISSEASPSIPDEFVLAKGVYDEDKNLYTYDNTNGEQIPMLPNGNYLGVITDDNGEINEFTFKIEGVYLTFRTHVQDFRQPNNILKEEIGDYKAIISNPKGLTQTSPFTRDIGGIITISDVVVNGEALEYFNIDIRPQEVINGYDGVAFSYLGTDSLPQNDNATGVSFDPLSMSFGVRVPKGDVVYQITITELCSDGNDTGNSVVKGVYVAEPLPYKMFINDVDYDLIKNFPKIVQADAESTLSVRSAGWNPWGTIYQKTAKLVEAKNRTVQYKGNAWFNLDHVWSKDVFKHVSEFLPITTKYVDVLSYSAAEDDEYVTFIHANRAFYMWVAGRENKYIFADAVNMDIETPATYIEIGVDVNGDTLRYKWTSDDEQYKEYLVDNVGRRNVGFPNEKYEQQITVKTNIPDHYIDGENYIIYNNEEAGTTTYYRWNGTQYLQCDDINSTTVILEDISVNDSYFYWDEEEQVYAEFDVSVIADDGIPTQKITDFIYIMSSAQSYGNKFYKWEYISYKFTEGYNPIQVTIFENSDEVPTNYAGAYISIKKEKFYYWLDTSQYININEIPSGETSTVLNKFPRTYQGDYVTVETVVNGKPAQSHYKWEIGGHYESYEPVDNTPSTDAYPVNTYPTIDERIYRINYDGNNPYWCGYKVNEGLVPPTARADSDILIKFNGIYYKKVETPPNSGSFVYEQFNIPEYGMVPVSKIDDNEYIMVGTTVYKWLDDEDGDPTDDMYAPFSVNDKTAVPKTYQSEFITIFDSFYRIRNGEYEIQSNIINLITGSYEEDNQYNQGIFNYWKSSFYIDYITDEEEQKTINLGEIFNEFSKENVNQAFFSQGAERYEYNLSNYVYYTWCGDYVIDGFNTKDPFPIIDEFNMVIYDNSNIEELFGVVNGFIEQANNILQLRNALPSLVTDTFYMTCPDEPKDIIISAQTSDLPAIVTTVYQEETTFEGDTIEYDDNGRKSKIYSGFNDKYLSTDKMIIGEYDGQILDISIPTITYACDTEYGNDELSKTEDKKWVPVVAQNTTSIQSMRYLGSSTLGRVNTQTNKAPRHAFYAGVMNDAGYSKPSGLSVKTQGGVKQISEGGNQLSKLFQFPIINKKLTANYIAWAHFTDLPYYKKRGGDNGNYILELVNMDGLLAGYITNGLTTDGRYTIQELDGYELQLSDNLVNGDTYVENRLILGYTEDVNAERVIDKINSFADGQITDEEVNVLQGWFHCGNIISKYNALEVVNNLSYEESYIKARPIVLYEWNDGDGYMAVEPQVVTNVPTVQISGVDIIYLNNDNIPFQERFYKWDNNNGYEQMEFPVGVVTQIPQYEVGGLIIAKIYNDYDSNTTVDQEFLWNDVQHEYDLCQAGITILDITLFEGEALPTEKVDGHNYILFQNRLYEWNTGSGVYEPFVSDVYVKSLINGAYQYFERIGDEEYILITPPNKYGVYRTIGEGQAKREIIESKDYMSSDVTSYGYKGELIAVGQSTYRWNGEAYEPFEPAHKELPMPNTHQEDYIRLFDAYNASTLWTWYERIGYYEYDRYEKSQVPVNVNLNQRFIEVVSHFYKSKGNGLYKEIEVPECYEIPNENISDLIFYLNDRAYYRWLVDGYSILAPDAISISTEKPNDDEPGLDFVKYEETDENNNTVVRFYELATFKEIEVPLLNSIPSENYGDLVMVNGQYYIWENDTYEEFNDFTYYDTLEDVTTVTEIPTEEIDGAEIIRKLEDGEYKYYKWVQYTEGGEIKYGYKATTFYLKVGYDYYQFEYRNKWIYVPYVPVEVPTDPGTDYAETAGDYVYYVVNGVRYDLRWMDDGGYYAQYPMPYYYEVPVSNVNNYILRETSVSAKIEDIVPTTQSFKYYVVDRDYDTDYNTNNNPDDKMQYIPIPSKTTYLTIEGENGCGIYEEINGGMYIEIADSLNWVNHKTHTVDFQAVLRNGPSDGDVHYSVICVTDSSPYPLNYAEKDETSYYINKDIGKEPLPIGSNGSLDPLWPTYDLFSHSITTGLLQSYYGKLIDTNFKSSVETGVTDEEGNETAQTLHGHGPTGQFETEKIGDTSYAFYVVAETSSHVRAISPVYDVSIVNGIIKYGSTQRLHMDVNGDVQRISENTYSVAIKSTEQYYILNYPYTFTGYVSSDTLAARNRNGKNPRFMLTEQTMSGLNVYSLTSISDEDYEWVKQAAGYRENNIKNYTFAEVIDYVGFRHRCRFDSNDISQAEKNWYVVTWYANAPDGSSAGLRNDSGLIVSTIEDNYLEGESTTIVDRTDRIVEDDGVYWLGWDEWATQTVSGNVQVYQTNEGGSPIASVERTVSGPLMYIGKWATSYMFEFVDTANSIIIPYMENHNVDIRVKSQKYNNSTGNYSDYDNFNVNIDIRQKTDAIGQTITVGNVLNINEQNGKYYAISQPTADYTITLDFKENSYTFDIDVIVTLRQEISNKVLTYTVTQKNRNYDIQYDFVIMNEISDDDVTGFDIGFSIENEPGTHHLSKDGINLPSGGGSEPMTYSIKYYHLQYQDRIFFDGVVVVYVNGEQYYASVDKESGPISLEGHQISFTHDKFDGRGPIKILIE